MLETLLITIIVLCFILNVVRRPKNYPPGPLPIPLLGNYFNLNLEDPQKLHVSVHAKYGGFTGLVLPKFKSVIVNGWESMREVLANEDCQGRPDVCLIRDRFDGGNHGVLFTEGELWRAQRHFALQNFRNFGFGRKFHESLIQDEGLQLVREFQNFGDKPFEVEELFYLTNINITWTLLSSTHYSHTDDQLKLLASSIKEMIHDVKIFGSPAVMFPFLRYIFPVSTGYKSVKRASKNIRSFVQREISQHRLSKDTENPRDFIDTYLNEIDKPNKDASFSELQLEGVCMDLLLAGSDTTTGYLSFIILFLCLRKDIQESVYHEVLSILGSDQLPSVDDKCRFVYTEAFLMEVFRLRAVAPTFPPHRVTKDTTLGGYNVPKGTIIFPNVQTVLMDKDYWGDPEVFRPERFITEDGKLKREERLIPFGKGKRSCLGDALTKMSSFLLVVILVQRLRFEFPPGFKLESTEGLPGFTLGAPKFRVVVSSRSRC